MGRHLTIASRVASPRKEDAPAAAPQETLNFKIPPEFKREFKGYAVSQGMTMIELLKEGFELSKHKRSAK